MYPYGLIGNCQASALVHRNGALDWLCLPRPDSPPVFGHMLDPDGGVFSIEPAGSATSSQHYQQNTNILVTTFTLQDGSQFSVTDFFPRYWQYGRMYKPLSVVRIVEPLRGAPSIKVVCRPIVGWEKDAAPRHVSNNHFSFQIRDSILRLTTNASLTYLQDETPFVLSSTTYFALTWNSPVEEELPEFCQRALSKTAEYWQSWVKHCSIPVDYQKQVIRSALALKLHCYDDTGAILAAVTTSLPEEVGHTRNWDYRYCWLRDSYYVLSAFHRLGHFEEMEKFLEFLLNTALQHEKWSDDLKPVYSLDRGLPIPEMEHSNWAGYKGSRPVRSCNQAAEHTQNDVYGEMILTLAPIYFDDRFTRLRSREHDRLLAHLLQLSVKTLSQPDAGLWEIRDDWKTHSFSTLMSWAGLDRGMKIQERGYLTDLKLDLPKAVRFAEDELRRGVFEGSMRNGPQDGSFDASLLQMPMLRFQDLLLNLKTVQAVRENLGLPFKGRKGSFLYRYTRPDDFGTPKSAFVICSFWLVQALAALGDIKAAREVMNDVLTSANEVGLLAEHFLPDESVQAGNFPQAYSHVGLINAAFAVSPKWDDIL